MEKAVNTPKKVRKPPPDDIFDQDYAWKTFISKHFFNFMKATQACSKKRHSFGNNQWIA